MASKGAHRAYRSQRIKDGPIEEVTLIEFQKQTRLKVNRVALIQELRAEHVVNYLEDKCILTEDEKKEILAAKSPGAKTKTLLDILPAKGRAVNWYGHFRDALRNPEVKNPEVKRKYMILVEFLDNTIIKGHPVPPSSIDRHAPKMKLPHYKRLPSISSTESPSKYRTQSRVTFDGNIDHVSREDPCISDASTQEEKGFIESSIPEAEDKDISTKDVCITVGKVPNQEGEEKSEEETKECDAYDAEQNMSDIEKNAQDEPDTEKSELDKPDGEQNVENMPKCSGQESPKKALITGVFHQWMQAPENFKSIVQEPAEHFKMLEDSEFEADKEQLQHEKTVLERMKHLELVYALTKTNQLPDGFQLSMTNAVSDILMEPQLFHLYYKYFSKMKLNMVDLALHISSSFCTFIGNLGVADDEEIRDHIVKVGFNLFDFLCGYGSYHWAEKVMKCMMDYLLTNPVLETWMAVWEGFVKLMGIRITNMDMAGADWAYNTAINIAETIKKVSFGQDLLDEADLFLQMSNLMLEQGCIVSGYQWAQKALQEVEEDNFHGIVNVLCTASRAYGMKWNVKRAEQLAVAAIHQAKILFGINHPMFVKALLNFSAYCNDFKQDGMGAETAKIALIIADKIYGSPSLQVAEAYRMYAESLLAIKQFEGDHFIDFATRAKSIAMDIVPGDHPRLSVFKFTFAKCLFWKAMNSPPEEKVWMLTWALSEAETTSEFFVSYFGPSNMQVAQLCVLLANILMEVDKPDEAKKQMQEAVLLHRLYLPTSSHYCHQMRAAMGVFLKRLGYKTEAMEYLKYAVDNVDPAIGVYIPWVHEAYTCLLDLLKADHKERDIKTYQTKLDEWMEQNSKDREPVTWDKLMEPPQPFESFLKDFNIWQSRINRVKKGLRNLKTNFDVLNKEKNT